MGGRLAARLLEEGVQTHLLLRPGGRARLGALPGKPVLHEHDGSTRGMLGLVARAAPDTVFHLAALTLAEHGPDDVEGLVRSNILLGVQLLEACVRAGAARFVNTGTFWQSPGSPRRAPACLYAATKQSFEDLLGFYAAATPLRALTLRLFDVYGPGDPRGKLLGVLRESARTGTPARLTPGRQRADFVYIDDVVDAYLRAARLLEERPPRAGVYAVRSGRTLSLRALVGLYRRVNGVRLEVEWGGLPYRPRQAMSPGGGRRLPGWKARVGLEEGLRRAHEAALG